MKVSSSCVIFLKCLLVKIQTTCVVPALPCMNRAALGLSRVAGVNLFVRQPSPCLWAVSFISSSLLVFYSQAWVKYLQCVQYCARYSDGIISHFSVPTKYWRVNGKRSLAQSGGPESWELCWLWWDLPHSSSVTPGQMASQSETLQGEVTSWVQTQAKGWCQVHCAHLLKDPLPLNIPTPESMLQLKSPWRNKPHCRTAGGVWEWTRQAFVSLLRLRGRGVDVSHKASEARWWC